MENFTIFLRLSSQPCTLKFRQKSDSILRFKMPKTTPCFWIRRPSRCCLDHNLDFFRNRLTFFLFIDSLNSSFVQFCGWMVTGNWILCRFFFQSWNLLSVCVFFGETSGRASGFRCSLWIDFLLPSFQKSLPSLYPRNSDHGRKMLAEMKKSCAQKADWLIGWIG